MVKTSFYSGLNPVVVQMLNNLQYRYSGETPEMWCSRVYYPFKKLLEYNPKYFSKNRFIQMIERSYKDGEFKAGRRSFNIYCTVCDSSVIIRENTIKCGNDHLKKCIAKTVKRHIAYSNPIQKNMKKKVSSELSDDEIEKIYQTFGFIFSKCWTKFSYAYKYKNRKRNDGILDEKKFLSPRAKDLPESFLNNLYHDGHISHEWVEKKSDQLHNRLENRLNSFALIFEVDFFLRRKRFFHSDFKGSSISNI
ncbi:hypothetical protein RhiirA1_399367 [Rhizophagus irregularis]|uniref:Uncharacterized protein n=1 Tax=Rhizophagus irregularis TaxID=588596 RepID=A0A2N0RA76_9GLOM|nr:hypothetical protein RhiirA1_399367 [Rhizophagus irregularis]